MANVPSSVSSLGAGTRSDRPLRSQGSSGLITGQSVSGGGDISLQRMAASHLKANDRAGQSGLKEEPALLLETFTHDPVSSHGCKHSIRRRSCLPPCCGRRAAVSALRNFNYTHFLPGMNSSPHPSTFSSSSRRPQDCAGAAGRDTNTSWQPPGRAGVTETRVSAAGWRNSGRRQFYCYLPKRANYIRSLMWNLFCRLSVNKLCGSSQAAYLTSSVPFPHTSSSTFTRAGSCRAFTGRTKHPLWVNKNTLGGSQQAPSDTRVSSRRPASFPRVLLPYFHFHGAPD